MRVHQVSKPNPVAQCHQPMKGQPLPTVGLDAKAQAVGFCATVWAKVETEHQSWQQLAVQLVIGTTDFRQAVVDQFTMALKQRRAEMLERCGVDESDKEGKKLAGLTVKSATVKVSELKAIAEGFNNGGTLEGLLLAAGPGTTGLTGINPVNFRFILDYARKFRKTTAGRPKHPWLVKVGKAFESTLKPGEDSTDEEIEQYALFIALYNKLSAEQAKNDAPF